MFRDHHDDEGMNRILARMDDRRSRMPLYLTGFLVSVAVIELVGQHLLT
ncbi:hypothetical protein AFCDBAGC_2770 [Methylobacterium cerastii]|uniref:Uncharacterized protein n=1 Tax=Methylobacterium cerastii TaxID=932741 RepID=A0ABQ4QJI4_9HYPH|nr:hypothetical protein AFCDBAGC_2770 [Methylobacterium cerastii]